jgi:hypothetical protein
LLLLSTDNFLAFLTVKKLLFYGEENYFLGDDYYLLPYGFLLISLFIYMLSVFLLRLDLTNADLSYGLNNCGILILGVIGFILTFY